MGLEMAYGIGAVILVFALIYGVIQSKTRNKANDKITDAATKELYAHPNRYANGEREQFKAQLKD